MHVLEAKFKVYPLGYPPRTLETLCMEKVIRLVQEWNAYPNQGKEFFDVIQQTTEPFFSYPRWITDQIFQSLTSKKEIHTIGAALLKIFLNFNLEQLTLPLNKIPKCDWPRTLAMVLPISGGLKKFRLSLTDSATTYACDNIREFAQEVQLCQLLNQLGSQMVNLVHLDIGGICCFHHFDCFAKNCPNLAILRGISNSISDDTLSCLAMNVKDPSDTKMRCQKLQELHAPFGTENITSKCIMTLLHRLPKLTVLEGFAVANALMEAHGRDYETSNKTYNLHNCKMSHYDYAKLSNIVPKMCPYLKELLLTLPSKEELFKFSELSNLTHINVIFPNHFNGAMFDECVVPLLKHNGASIILLYLINIHKMDFFLVDHFCPHLEAFGAYHFREVSESEVEKNEFQNLDCLTLIASNGTVIPRNSLKLLFRNSLKLSFLWLKNIAFPNNALHTILKTNPLKCLSSLTLSCVEGVGHSIIESLVNRVDSRLEIVDIETNDGEFFQLLHNLRNLPNCTLKSNVE